MFLLLTLWEDYRHTAAWQGLKAVFSPSLQGPVFFTGSHGWTYISRIQENYLQFSVSSQASSMISVPQTLSLASVLMSVSPRGGI